MTHLFLKLMKLNFFVILSIPFGDWLEKNLLGNFSVAKAVFFLILIDALAGFLKHRKLRTASVKGFFKFTEDLTVVGIMLIVATQLGSVQNLQSVYTEGLSYIIGGIHTGILVFKTYSIGQNLNAAYPGWVPFFDLLRDKMKEKNLIHDENKN